MMESSDFRKKLESLYKTGQQNSPEYQRLKEKYLSALIEESQENGNRAIADLAQQYLEHGRDKGFSSVDLQKFDKELNKIKFAQEAESIKQSVSKKEIEKLFNDNSKTVYERFIELFYRAVSLIRIKLLDRLENNNYRTMIQNKLQKYFEERNLSYSFYYDTYNSKKDIPSHTKTEYRKTTQNVRSLSSSLTFGLVHINTGEYKKFNSMEKYSMKYLSEKVPEVKKETLYAYEESEPYRKIKAKENNTQKEKYNLWVDILALLDKKGIHINKHKKLKIEES